MNRGSKGVTWVSSSCVKASERHVPSRLGLSLKSRARNMEIVPLCPSLVGPCLKCWADYWQRGNLPAGKHPQLIATANSSHCFTPSVVSPNPELIWLVRVVKTYHLCFPRICLHFPLKNHLHHSLPYMVRCLPLSFRNMHMTQFWDCLLEFLGNIS